MCIRDRFAAGDISQTEMEQAANALNDAKRQVEGYTVVDLSLIHI